MLPPMLTTGNYLDPHYIHRSDWLRAAVPGANDGIISVSSLVNNQFPFAD